MPIHRRLSVLSLFVMMLMMVSLSAPGTEEAPEETTDDSVATTDGGVSGAVPAVTVPADVADAGPDDWTYRYLIPTLIALAVVVVIFTTIQYFLQVVRKRYKVVE